MIDSNSYQYLEPKVNYSNEQQQHAVLSYGIVHFATDPSGAKIFVDGKPLTNPEGEYLRTPATAHLLEGRRDFVLSLEGYEDAIGYVDVMTNVSGNVNRNLKPGKSEHGWGTPQPQINLHEHTSTVNPNTFAMASGSKIVINEPDLCVTTRLRDINVTINDIPSRSILTSSATFSYESQSQDIEGTALCLGSTILRLEEIDQFVHLLGKVGIDVISITNPWLSADPPLSYINWVSIENPLNYAVKMDAIFSIFK